MKSRDNPFASRYIESLAYQCLTLKWEEIMQRLPALKYRAAIIGPEGTGKTTLLEEIGEKLKQKGLNAFYFRCDKKTFHRTISEVKRTSSSDSAFLIDSAEQLNWLVWKQLYFYIKKAKAVIICSHKKGRLPTLLTTSTTPALLYNLALELVGEKQMPPRQEINRLFSSHHGNIRLAFRELYDSWATRDE